MNILDVHDLRKSFGTRVLFTGADFSVQEGEKVGFIGANGSGKSTLFRMVAGEEGADSGTIARRRGATSGLLSQEPAFGAGESIRSAVAAGHPEMASVVEEYREVSHRVAEGGPDSARLLARHDVLLARIHALGGWDWEHRVEEVLTRIGLDEWERPVEGLSGGERKRVALARVLLQAPDLLLLDEPTNHLDADTTAWLEEYLLEYAGAVMLITHDRYFLDRVVTRMIEIDRGQLTPYVGGYTEYLEARAERMARLEVEERKRVRLIEQELEWVKRSPAARTGKQKARIQRLRATQVEQERNRLPTGELVDVRFGTPPRLGRTVLELREVTKSFDGRTLIDGLTSSLRAGERVGIVGPNGAGKTTLLRLILGMEPLDRGSIELGENTRIAYFDQERTDLDPEASVIRAVASEDWVIAAGKRVHVRSYLESFLFPQAVLEQRVRSLSGGERNRLLLARLFLEDANLLILDEPTNDLDLTTLQVLESALAEFPGCLLVVTHDRFFLDKIATGLLVFEGGGVVRKHEGSYELYRRLREERAAAESMRGREAPARPRKPEQPPPAVRRLSHREKQELLGMEEAIVRAEEERDRLGAMLANSQLYVESPERVAAVAAEFRAAGERVEQLYVRWAELEEHSGTR